MPNSTYHRSASYPIVQYFTRLLLAFCLLGTLPAAAASQGDKVTIVGNNLPLKRVFNAIEDQTGYGVFMDDKLMEETRAVSLSVKDATIQEVLRQCLRSQPLPLDFKIQGTTITIIKKKEVSSVSTPSSIPTVGVTVKNAEGAPLVGATVTILELKVKGQTNENGEYEQKGIPNGRYHLRVTYVGYQSSDLEVVVFDNQIQLTVEMKLTVNSMEETVIKGYYNTTKTLNTGNVSTVKGADIEKQPVSNPLLALEGRVPGLFITQTNGLPGSSVTVRIRGQNSIDNGNDPYYIIDGVPYVSQTLGSINSLLKGGSPLNFINPSDIESIEVLKDADATSIYGSRAANGVILITTKKGKAGATKVDLNAYTGVGKVTRMVHLLNTQQYLQMRHEAFKNDGAIPAANAYDVNGTWDTTRYTDWQKVLIGNSARYTNAQTSVSGGNTNTQFLIGGGYHRETTVFPGDNADQKASAHFSVNNLSPNKKFKISLSGNYTADNNTVSYLDFTTRALNLAPDAPAIYKADGSLNWAPTTPGRAGSWTNPFSSLFLTYQGRTNNLVSNAILSYVLLPGLELKANLGYTNMQTNEVYTKPLTSTDPGANVKSGSSQFNSTSIRSWIAEPQANYKLNLGEGVLNFLVGSTFSKNSSDGQILSATGFTSDAFLKNIHAATSVTTGSTISSQYKYVALFGRLGYNWQDKYLLNLTVRRDGSSRFGPENQFANFGAIGAGWIFSKENFFQNSLPFISFGKLRVSYGTSGNDQIGDYKFLDLYNNTQYPYQGTQGLFPANLFNPVLSWELNKKIEGGIELGLLKDLITINANYYRNRSGNQLVTTPLSLVTGFNSIPSNLPAVVQNTGLEFSVNTVNIKKKKFTWTSSFNLTIPNNKLISFPNLSNSTYNYNLIIGQPITIQKVFHLTGVNPASGVYQFSDYKGASTFYPDATTDRTVLINTSPKFYGGFENNLQFKGFNLDFLFQFIKQTGSNLMSAYTVMPGTMGDQPVSVLNRWQRVGDVKPVQQFSQNYSGDPYNGLSYATSSNLIYSDASFVRLKNLSISYTLPALWLQKAHFQNARIYLLAQNLFTITNYSGLDPETQGSSLPPLRVITAGIQVTL